MKRTSHKTRLLLLISSLSLCEASVLLTQAAPTQTPPAAQKPAPARTPPPSTDGFVISGPGHNIPGPHDNWNMGAAERADIAGDAAWAKGDFAGAEADYRKAVAAWPEDSEALYGLGQSAARQGDAVTAAAYYRQGVYKSYGLPPKLVLDESLPYPLMEYALLLQQAGEKDEALRIYQHAVGLLNFRDGKPNLSVPLPEFGAGTHPTPAQFQAMALVGIAIDRDGWDQKRVVASLDQAAARIPDSPLPYFYRAKHNSGYDDRVESARADFQKAIQLGDAKTAEAAQERLKSLPPPPTSH